MKTIMIIEDDAAIRDSLQELLESEGYNVILAEHGQVALSFLETNQKLDAILLDLSMPVMDGKTFLREITRLFPALGRLPIIIMTAAGPGEIPRDYAKERVLRKPLDVDELISKIEMVTEAAQIL